jgi:hypothetical protein
MRVTSSELVPIVPAKLLIIEGLRVVLSRAEAIELASLIADTVVTLDSRTPAAVAAKTALSDALPLRMPSS